MKLTRAEDIAPRIDLGPRGQLELSRPLVMGIVNVTPDSFSDGRPVDANRSIEQALSLAGDGADILDIGGESSRPGADPVGEAEEMARVLPVIEGIRAENPIPISIDTYKAATARAALAAGADMVNDISALRFDAEMAQLLAGRQSPVVLMHMLGSPRTMQQSPHYVDSVAEISQFFEERIEFCRRAGIDKSRLILDPGIGFGKRLVDNLEILRRFGEFRRLGLPLLIGTSRKSFINMVAPADLPAAARLGGSIASMLAAVTQGARIVRVHDVRETVEALKIAMAIGTES